MTKQDKPTMNEEIKYFHTEHWGVFPSLKHWRKGQTLYNFLAWLTEKKRKNITSQRMTVVDTFDIDDEKLEQWFQEFLVEHKDQNE